MLRTTFGLLAIVVASGVLAWALHHHADLEFTVGTMPATQSGTVHVAAHRAGS